MFRAVQPKLAVLDRTDSAYCGSLVLRQKFKASLASESPARLRRRHRLFHGNIQLARFAGLFVSEFFSTWTVVSVVDLSRGMHFAFWAWFIGLLISPQRSRLPGAICWLRFLAAAAWVTHEWIRGWLFTGFGWNGLGVSLHAQYPVIQIAEFTGVTGLSFAVAFVNIIAVTTPVRLFLEAKTRRMRPHFDLTLTMIGIVALMAFGLDRIQTASPSKSMRVAAVQANVPQLEKFDPQFTREIFEKFTRLSDVALRANPPPDLLVWPESSMPDAVRDENGSSNRFVKQLVASSKTDLLLGTLDFEPGSDYNAAVSFQMAASGCRSIARFIWCRSANTFRCERRFRYSLRLPEPGCPEISPVAPTSPCSV